MLQVVYYILFSIVLLFSLYFALLAIFAFVKRKSPIATRRKNKICSVNSSEK